VKLNALGQEHQQLTATVEKQKAQLSKLLREQYVAGNEDRIKLLLSGDNPNRINRDLQLMAYVSQAQARLLDALRANLLAVEKTRRTCRTPRMNWKKSRRKSATRRPCWCKRRRAAPPC